MNYVLALFLPPLSILLIGRPFVAVVTFVIWIPAILRASVSPRRIKALSGEVAGT
jgi:hypothetical protein